ncbi:5-carboxymethyl-2-hydroxymuconate isomerase [Bacillus pumilus]|uniref:5-carboxymethyl-2-hydroxymuconate isomerase n=1 Tax=Bacillus pumilus TaxID=1408 RepID=A0A2A5INF7_BACPU|nr:5-carboxymethyl-2-hydroxymuconate Delta-isomerase [Bacillus pumilus]PCK18589.1 5-carboxymethyl-2-hydroxymuconate isomerase [Bacillus pumilus]
MPHIIVEYTDNIKKEANMTKLLRNINQAVIAQGGVFPTGGIRTRAIELTDYVVADGTEDDSFVHTALKIGAGRTIEEKRAVGDAIFSEMTEHFSELFNTRYLALSLEIIEFSEAGTYKKNNIHQRYKNKN